MKIKMNMLSVLLIGGGICFAIQCLFAQSKTLPQYYNPVVIKGENMPVQKFDFSQWSAFSYAEKTQQWKTVPFQMDKMDETGKFLPANDGILDQNDELLFMPEDASDRAPQNVWLDESLSSEPERLEVELINPKNDNEKAWIYLFKNVSSHMKHPGYFTYLPDSRGGAADTIQTNSYKIGHNKKGWTDFVALNPQWTTDVIDRIKFHVSNSGATPFTLTEDTLNFSTQTFYKKPIRSFQDVNVKIKLNIFPFPPVDVNDHFTILFLPYSTLIEAGFTVESNLKGFIALLQLRNIRMSVDFSGQIKNFYFYSAFNTTGFSIDGIQDSPNIHLPGDQNNWVMASGESGTVAAFFTFPGIQGIQNKFIYYRDNHTGGTNEGTADTGDMKSFGDMGIWILGEALVPRETSLFISFNTYFINEGNKTADFGEKLLSEIQNPLLFEVRHQQRFTTDVSDNEYYPDNYTLLNAYPNPFYHKNVFVTFQIQSEKILHSSDLIVYNSRVQEIQRYQIEPAASGLIQKHWNGKDKNNLNVPAGVYFYRFTFGRQSVTQKLLILP